MTTPTFASVSSQEMSRNNRFTRIPTTTRTYITPISQTDQTFLTASFESSSSSPIRSLNNDITPSVTISALSQNHFKSSSSSLPFTSSPLNTSPSASFTKPNSGTIIGTGGDVFSSEIRLFFKGVQAIIIITKLII